jgi:hypothetical protein
MRGPQVSSAWVVSEAIADYGLRDLRVQALPTEAQATERGLIIPGITFAFDAEGKLHVVPCS